MSQQLHPHPAQPSRRVPTHQETMLMIEENQGELVRLSLQDPNFRNAALEYINHTVGQRTNFIHRTLAVISDRSLADVQSAIEEIRDLHSVKAKLLGDEREQFRGKTIFILSNVPREAGDISQSLFDRGAAEIQEFLEIGELIAFLSHRIPDLIISVRRLRDGDALDLMQHLLNNYHDRYRPSFVLLGDDSGVPALSRGARIYRQLTDQGKVVEWPWITRQILEVASKAVSGKLASVI